MKRILTIQDISCVGKCSLTVALPIISAMGIECAVLPTAVLSTHTAFNGFTFRDLTDDMQTNYEHWLNQNIYFDCIYTGYLGSIKQLDLVGQIFDKFKRNNTLTIVDPVMADNGKLYKGFNLEFAKSMLSLCCNADIIVPNLTEASFLLNQEYIPNGYSEDYIRDTLKKLTQNGAKTAILTGVSFEKESLGVYAYDSIKDEYFYYFREHLPKSFHGTGDVFASTLSGALCNNKDIKSALKIAVDFTVESIKQTINNPNSNWYGVDFETAIPYLIKSLN